MSGRLDRDGLLFGFAIAVIIVMGFPRMAPRQVVDVSQADGSSKQFAIPIDDPLLADVRRRFRQIPKYLPPADLSVARWNHELSRLYAEAETASSESKPTVVQVRFVEGLESSDSPVVDSIGVDSVSPFRQHWIEENKAADEAISRALEKQATKVRRRQPPPVQFGEELEGRVSPVTLTFAILSVMVGGWGYGRWRRVTPTLTLGVDRTQALELACWQPGSATQSRFEVPCQSIRMVQSPQVWIRRAGFLAVVSLALVMLALH